MTEESHPKLDYTEGVPVPTFHGIQEAFHRLKPIVNRTPLLTSRTLNDKASAAVSSIVTGTDGEEGRGAVKIEVALKCENFQKVGAFKYRGASNAMLKCIDRLNSDPAPPTTLYVFTHSSGNFAQAIASSAKNLSTPSLTVMATIVMPFTAPKSKREGVIEYGAVVVGCDNALRAQVCDEEIQKAKAEGKTTLFLPSYDHLDVIEGHGGIMLEVESQAQSLNVWGMGATPDVVLCPIGGGGLISGVSLGAKGVYGSEVTVVGVEPTGADDAYRSLATGEWQKANNPTRTICDGLLTATGFLTLPTIKRNVDEVILVDDEATIRAMRFVWERMKIIIEPSSAMTVAALLGHAALDLQSSAEWRQVVRNVLLRRQQKGDKSTTVRVCVIIGGGNVSFDKVFEWFRDSETLREG